MITESKIIEFFCIADDFCKIADSTRSKHCTTISHNAPILKTINAILADVTSHAADDLKKLSPFYPHGGIPMPFSEGVTVICVEAVGRG